MDSLDAAIKSVLNQYPTLCSEGFSSGCSSLSLIERRKLLINQTDEIAKAVAVLKDIPKQQSFYKKETSYGIKHLLTEYIGNGAFIVAAIICGFKTKRINMSSPNCLINISSKAIAALK